MPPDLAGMAQEALKNPDTIKQLIENPKDIGDVLLGKKPASPTTAAPAETTAAPATAPTEKEQRQQMIEQGIGGLLKGL